MKLHILIISFAVIYAKKPQTTNSLLLKSNKLIEALIEALQQLSIPTTASSIQLARINKQFVALDRDVTSNLRILNSWDSTIEAVHRFVQDGSQAAVEQGSPGTKLKGDIHSTTRFDEVCEREGLPVEQSCAVRGTYEFEIHRAKDSNNKLVAVKTD